jgi:hypothetical protein
MEPLARADNSLRDNTRVTPGVFEGLAFDAWHTTEITAGRGMSFEEHEYYAAPKTKRPGD